MHHNDCYLGYPMKLVKQSLLVFIFACTPLVSEAKNPFSTDFVLDPYQIESSSELAYLNSTYSINSVIFKNTDESRFINYTQGLSIGLPQQFQVGIFETYANPLHKNPLNPGEGKSGLKAPLFSADKLMSYSDNLAFKASLSIKPNLTGSKEILNTYQVGILAISKVKADLDLSLGYSRTRYELAKTDADIFTLVMSKKFDEDTLLNLRYDATKWSATATTLGNFSSSMGHQLSAEISTSVAKDLWVGVNATYYYNKCNFTPVSLPIEYTNKTDLYNVSGVIKFLF